jgi:hypothetical protein
MSDNVTPTLSAEQAEATLRQRLGGHIRELRVLIRAQVLVLQGVAVSYYGKQMAQHLAHKLLGLPIVANEIEVRSVAVPTQDEDG